MATMCCWVQVNGSAKTDRQFESCGLEEGKNIVNRIVGFRTRGAVRLLDRRTLHNNTEGNQSRLRKIRYDSL